MLLAGVKVPAHQVVLLARLLDSEEPLAAKLRRAIEHEQTIVALDVQERERLGQVLENAPPVFSDLKQTLRQHTSQHPCASPQRGDRLAPVRTSYPPCDRSPKMIFVVTCLKTWR